jgi:cell wall-associated NlpC family hydrolase
VTHRPRSRCTCPVSHPRNVISLRRGQARYVLIGLLTALLVAVPALATPAPTISSKQAEARQVLADLDQLDASLGAANERLNLANLRLERVQHEIEENTRALRVARHNLRRSQETIARRLVTLYTKGETSTLEVILGARSLGEVLNRIDTQNRVSTLDAQVIHQVRTFKTAVKRHASELRRDREHARRLVAERAAQKRSFEAQIVERHQLLSTLNAEIQRMIATQRALDLQRALAARSRYIEAQARQSQSIDISTVGATAETPEGAIVLPSSQYGGAVGVALSFVGTPYVWGGASPGGFDCSGLVMYAYGQVGVSLPHSSYALWNVGVPVPRDQLQPGDLVFFSGLGHVGIYMGGGQFVHAPQTGDVVKVSSIDAHGSFVGARRIL